MLTRVQEQKVQEAEAFAAELRTREEEMGALLLDEHASRPHRSPHRPHRTPSLRASAPPHPVSPSLTLAVVALNPPLGAVLLDSRAKTVLLAEALASQTSAQAKLQALHGRTAEAERMHAATQRQLRRLDADLAAVRAERLNLESELASVQAIAAGEISALEEARAVEVRAARGGYASPLGPLALTSRLLALILRPLGRWASYSRWPRRARRSSRRTARCSTSNARARHRRRSRRRRRHAPSASEAKRLAASCGNGSSGRR